MKLREILFGLGLKPAPREWPFEVDSFNLPDEGQIQYARWLHPKEGIKEITHTAIQALRAFLKPGDVAIDIGAHTGDSTVPIALAVGAQGAVFALEPNPFTFKVLQANAGLNRDKTNIIPLMFAATPEDGEMEFQYSDAGYSNGGLHQGINRWRHAHFFNLRVQGRNLLRYLQQQHPRELARVRYIKIDTEGFDRTVAGSLRELLVRNRPFIKSEIYELLEEETRRGYYRDLRELGYRVHKFNSEEDYSGPELTEGDLMRWKHYDIFAVPL
jgi:FkbM family methyltransferase